MRERLSEQVGEQLTKQIVASIRRMTDEQLEQLVRSQCADEAALRAENERLRALRVPNLDKMTVEELDWALRELRDLESYADELLHEKTYHESVDDKDAIYRRLRTPWAKFREE